MLTLGIPVIGVTDLDRAIAFWTAALPLVESPEWRTDTWSTLRHADGSGRALGLMLSQSPPEPRPRVHLDLFAATAEEQTAEVDRLLALGAKRVDWPLYPADPDFLVLADPDDNIFCVVDLSSAPSGA
jgi:catechol 2,3-dioxygenase-like lactoylglutathione lyase family enzyme